MISFYGLNKKYQSSINLPVQRQVNNVYLLETPQAMPKRMRPLHFIGVSAQFIKLKPPKREMWKDQWQKKRHEYSVKFEYLFKFASNKKFVRFDIDSFLNANCSKIILSMKEGIDKLYVPYGLRWSMPSSEKEGANLLFEWHRKTDYLSVLSSHKVDFSSFFCAYMYNLTNMTWQCVILFKQLLSTVVHTF